MSKAHSYSASQTADEFISRTRGQYKNLNSANGVDIDWGLIRAPGDVTYLMKRFHRPSYESSNGRREVTDGDLWDALVRRRPRRRGESP